LEYFRKAVDFTGKLQFTGLTRYRARLLSDERLSKVCTKAINRRSHIRAAIKCIGSAFSLRISRNDRVITVVHISRASQPRITGWTFLTRFSGGYLLSEKWKFRAAYQALVGEPRFRDL